VSIVETAASLITSFIAQTSYLGIILLMGLESANIPIPSEIVLPFSGFLVSRGTLDFWLVALAGAIGCTIGSIGSYFLGRWSNQTWIRGWISGWGQVLITPEELALGEKWLARHGTAIVFISRVVPVVRTFISFPAGMAKIELKKFVVYTFIGSLLWSILLTYIGLVMGENWGTIEPIFRQFDLAILAAVIISLAWFLVHRGKRFVKKG